MDLAILAAELADPLYANMTHQAAADTLNAKTIPHPLAQMSIKALKQLTMITPIALTANGTDPSGAANLWHIIKDKAVAGVIPMSILWDLFQDIDFQSVDFYEGGIQKAMLLAGFDNLVADTGLLFSEGDKTALMTAVLALAPIISRAEQLGLDEVKYYDVGQARSIPNGN